jgi:hypothetical protein
MKRTLPDWYKNAESTYIPEGGGEPMAGLKKCMPYVDMMVTGYALVFPTDVYVNTTADGQIDISWDRSSPAGEFIAERDVNMGATMPRPYGFAPNHLVFSGRWGWRTPKGWSTLVTHPLNRVDLPFHTVSAFMDSDEFHGAGNIPFFIRDNWEGVIKEGTPFAQIIPIKRSGWKMVDNDQSLVDKLEMHVEHVRTDETPYKKTMWHRKEYN